MATSAVRDPTDHLLAARNALRAGLAHSHALAESLNNTTPRLDRIRRRLPDLEAAVRPARASRQTLRAARGHIDSALGPAAVVLKVFDAVHGLEAALVSGPCGDLHGYLSLVRRLEEALRLLGDNCGLAVQWLDEIVDYLRDNAVADDKYVTRLREATKSLKAEAADGSPLHGGLLDAALDRLEDEFRILLADHSTPMPLTLPPSPPSTVYRVGGINSAPVTQVLAPPPIPASVVTSLMAVLQCLASHGRADRCAAIYADIRGTNLHDTLEALGLDYLDVDSAAFDGVQRIEPHILRWEKHLEFAIKHLFDAEYKLCAEVFDRAGPRELWLGCFSEIAERSGFGRFLQFGKAVTESKKDPIKLLKLLDIFSCLSKLRQDFNRLFGGDPCAEIRAQTRDLIKRIVEGTCEIFFELLVQVELQRSSSPPIDGGVQKLVSFMLLYCNQLLGDIYRNVLTEVLNINRSWNRERHHHNQDNKKPPPPAQELLRNSVLDIIKALEQNCEAWAESYPDKILSHVFLMNAHAHFYKNLKGTSVGELLGKSWLKEREQLREYYAKKYLDSWRKLPELLSREGLILLSGGGRATGRDLVKKRLRAFNQEFDDMYTKHSSWIVPDREMREKVCRSVIDVVVPVYKNYMQNYGQLLENSADSRYIKYSVDSMEAMLASMFSRRPSRSVSFGAGHPGDILSRLITTNQQYQSVPTGVYR